MSDHSELIAELREGEWSASAYHARLHKLAADALAALPQPAEGGAVDVGVEYAYSHRYMDQGGGWHTRHVTEAQFRERKPDGHMADGTPYWNYTQWHRVVAGLWSPASPPTADGAGQ